MPTSTPPRPTPAPAAQPAQPPTGRGATLRVVSLNVRRLRDDRAAVVRLLREEEPDVVAVQEPPRGPSGRARLRRLAQDAGLAVVVAGGGARTTALLARPGLPVLGARGMRLRWTPPRTRRGLAVAEVAGVRVVAVHLGLHAAERAVHAVRLTLLVAATPGPVVLAGDLNEPPSGATWRLLLRYVRDLSTPTGPTYPAHQPRARIDAVLGAGVEVVAPAHARSDDTARAASDHLPVVVDVVTGVGR